jgi:predicted nicotinamide N-methyase
MDRSALEAMLAHATELRAPPLVPEVMLHLMPRDCAFEAFRARVEPDAGLAPPYWAVAWPGGQALARYVLENPASVAGRRVIDAGAGCGLAAIAAARAGARSVVAIEPDATARAVSLRNAAANGAVIEARTGDVATVDPASADLVLAGDLWYEAHLARRATAALRKLADTGVTVLAGDPGRAAFPRSGVDLLATYALAAGEELERAAILATKVWRVLGRGR